MNKTEPFDPNIRSATLDDLAAIDALIFQVWEDSSTDLKCLTGETRLMGKDLARYLNKAENLTIVHAAPNSSIDGVVFLTRVGEEVFDLGIVAWPPGKGVGSKLIDAAIRASEGSGVRQINLDVFVRNPACRLYRRKGFQDFDRLIVTNQRGEELPLFRMRLLLGGLSLVNCCRRQIIDALRWLKVIS